MYDGRDVANCVLDICEELGVPVANLSLQKIVYFCHVWTLIELGKPLVKHHFEAWEHGPVLSYVYHEFKRFGADNITDRAKKLDKCTGRKVLASIDLEEDVSIVVLNAVKFYARLSPYQLVTLSHVQDGPWWSTWQNGEEINLGMKIQDLDIARFYSTARRPFVIQ